MPRKPPPAPPKGTKWPGAGRAKGTPNRISVEVRQLVNDLVTNANYQYRLRRDFQARKVHPTIESMVWAYFLGKPKQDVTINATVEVNARIEEEKRMFASLDMRDLEQFAVESQSMVDRAMALAKARATGQTPQGSGGSDGSVIDVLCLPEVSEETLRKTTGSDNAYDVNQTTEPSADGGTPTGSDS